MKVNPKVVGGLVVALTILLAYYAGRRHHDPTVTWYSDMTNQLQGHKVYMIDTDVSCPPHAGPQGLTAGKTVGHLSIDLNLYNGQFKIVQNTVPAYFSCK